MIDKTEDAASEENFTFRISKICSQTMDSFIATFILFYFIPFENGKGVECSLQYEYDGGVESTR